MDYESAELDAVSLAIYPKCCIVFMRTRWCGVKNSVGEADHFRTIVKHACFTVVVMVYGKLTRENDEIFRILEDNAVKLAARVLENCHKAIIIPVDVGMLICHQTSHRSQCR